jgi:hypothetical protein
MLHRGTSFGLDQTSVSPWSRALKKLMGAHVVKIFRTFCGTGSSLTSQGAATGPIQSHINPVLILTSQFFKIHLNTVLLSMLRLPPLIIFDWEVWRPLHLSTLPYVMHVPLSHSFLFGHDNYITWRGEINEPPYYAVFSILLLYFPPSAPWSQTSAICVLPLGQRSLIHIQNKK